jgi:hypothetical protein
LIGQALRRGGIGQLVDVITAGDDDVVAVMRRDGPAAYGESALRANRATFRDGMVAFETPEGDDAAAPG